MRTRPLLIALCLLLGPAREATSQLIRLSPSGGELGVEMLALESAITGRSPVRETYLTTWLNFPFTGTVVSPRFLTYHAAVRPTRTMQSTRGGAAGSELRALGLSGGATLLPAFPISLSLQADRTTAEVASEGFGQSSDARNGSGFGLLRLRLPAFPLRVEWNSIDRADASLAAGQVPIRRDESLDLLRLTGESSKLTTTFERQRFSDRIGALDFTSASATALHALRWGHGSSLTSTVESFRREGRDEQVRRGIAEHLHLQHSATVASDLTVHRQRSRSVGDYEAAVGTTILSVHAEPRSWLSTHLTGGRTTNTFTAGQLRSFSASPSATLRQPLPGGVRLSATIGAAYQRTDQQLTASIATPVNDEAHTVGAGRVLALRHERADALTVVVFSRDRTVLYLEGPDYRVVALGDLLRIEVPLASRIQVGDLILVSYAYAAPSARSHDLRSLSASLLLLRGDVTVHHDAILRRARVLAGDDENGLEGGDDQVTGIDVRHPVRGIQTTLGLTHRSRQRSRADFSSSELRLGLRPPMGPRHQASVGASLARSSESAQSATVWSTNASWSWMPLASLTVATTGESQVWRRVAAGPDRTILLGLDLRWRTGRIESQLRYQWQQRSTLARHELHRVHLRMERRF